MDEYDGNTVEHDGEYDETEAECIDVEVADDEIDDVSPAPSVILTPTKARSTCKRITATTTTIAAVSKVSKTMPMQSQTLATTPTPMPACNTNTNTPNNAKKSKKRRESATSSDEERWLTAIESGKLDDVDDELKKMKDPKLMTARQRAMYERSQLDREQAPTSPAGELLLSLPTGYRDREKPQTAEDIQKAALKSQKRKQQADEKREKDKKKTMERLLRKQESKQRTTARSRAARAAEPMISYRDSITEGASIRLPPDVEFPLQAQMARAPPAPQLCGIAGCGQPKVYNCSKTNLPLCSFACYRKNVEGLRQIMC